MTNPGSANAESWTIGRLLTWTTDYLREHGSDSPRLDAEVLLAHARGCQRIDLYTAFNEEPGEEVRVAFREMIRRRAEATPVAYLVGHKEFYSLDFLVTDDVLIPRPETELLVVALLDKVKESAGNNDVHIADVGTGSGILAVCAAKHVPNARVTAIDISEKALAVARRNAEKHQVSQRIDFVESDLFGRLTNPSPFDFIVSNPPYVSESEYEELAADVRDHEPKVALTAGSQGTDVIERLIPQAADRLRASGYLMMEISPMIARVVQQLVRDNGRFDEPAVIKDGARLERIVVAQRSS